MLEATMVVLDDSEWMRNGDFPPTRWDAQIDASRILFDAKVGSNPESKVGLMTMAGRGPRVLASLTQEMGKILTSLHGAEPAGSSDLPTAVSIAQLALKHRQNKSQQQRIVVFVGSPVEASDEELLATGKKLKKNNVALDIISFGEEVTNETKLRKLVESVNSGDNSHLVTVSAGRRQLLSDVLLSSPILMDGEGGAGSSGGGGDGDGLGFGVDPNMDPELAMALRMSLEEEQARQRAAEATSSAQPSLAPVAETAETRGPLATTSAPTTATTRAPAATGPTAAPSTMPSGGSLVPPSADDISGAGLSAADESEDGMLQRALALSRGPHDGHEDVEMGADGQTEEQRHNTAFAAASGSHDEDEEMTEEEAIAHAIQMSLQENGADADQSSGQSRR